MPAIYQKDVIHVTYMLKRHEVAPMHFVLPFFSGMEPQWRCVFVWEGWVFRGNKPFFEEGGGGSAVTGSS